MFESTENIASSLTPQDREALVFFWKLSEQYKTAPPATAAATVKYCRAEKINVSDFVKRFQIDPTKIEKYAQGINRVHAEAAEKLGRKVNVRPNLSGQDVYDVLQQMSKFAIEMDQYLLDEDLELIMGEMYRQYKSSKLPTDLAEEKFIDEMQTMIDLKKNGGKTEYKPSPDYDPDQDYKL